MLGTTDEAETDRGRCRARLRALTLENALRKRRAGVPTYTVPEAAALLSLSHEYLYRLIHDDTFPALSLRRAAAGAGRYVVPAEAVERLLDAAASSGSCVDVGEWVDSWRARSTGGVA